MKEGYSSGLHADGRAGQSKIYHACELSFLVLRTKGKTLRRNEEQWLVRASAYSRNIRPKITVAGVGKYKNLFLTWGE